MEATQAGIDNILKSAPKLDMKGGDEELKAATAPKKAQTFGEAFKAARAAGEKTFSWAGKPGTTFTTKTAGEGAKRSVSTGRSGTGSSTAAKSSTPAPASKASAPVKAAAPSVSANTSKFLSKLPLMPSKSTSATPASKPTKTEAPKPKGRVGIASATKLAAPKPNIPAANLGPKKVDWSKANKPSANAPVKRAEPPKPKPGSLLLKRDEPKKDTVKFPLKRAKGGSIDGIAQRGKTRAPLKKGK